MKLSILMPAYNEEPTIKQAVAAVLDQEYPCDVELVVVDDGSQIPVPALLEDFDDPKLRVCRHAANLGKGAALRRAAALASGTHMVPLDADLEYDPADLVRMLVPVLQGRCNVVYGTRLLSKNTQFQSASHRVANRLLTMAANLTFNSYISDLHTCLKLMPLDLFRSFPLREAGFGFDTEITARILRTGTMPFEVPVSYRSRSRADGKKISWRDGVSCLNILARIRRAPLRTITSAVDQQGKVQVPADLAPELGSRGQRRTPRKVDGTERSGVT